MANDPIHQLTFQRFGEEHLLCQICQDLYKEPKNLNCLHAFCKNCLKTLYDQSPDERIQCPVCRQVTVIQQGALANIKTDFKLAGMVEAVLNVDKQSETIPICKSHAGKKCWFYCETCSELICLTCVKRSHSQHEVEEIGETEISEKRKFVKEHVPKFNKYLIEILAGVNTVSRMKQEFETALTTSKKEVEYKANQEIARVNAQKNQIINEINKIKTERDKIFNGYQKDFDSMSQTVNDVLKASDLATKENSNFDFLKHYPTVKSGSKFITDNPVPNIDPDVSTMAFKPTKTAGNISLGRLRTKSVHDVEDDENDAPGIPIRPFQPRICHPSPVNYPSPWGSMQYQQEHIPVPHKQQYGRYQVPPIVNSGPYIIMSQLWPTNKN